ncbi:MAG: TonB-dependent receptor [Bacteroidetes bacterium]|nr:TonB-dependent receptor [Bacteroidota bacterium]
MHFRAYSLILLFLFTSWNLKAQLKGKVVDANNEPLPMVNLVLLQDGSLVQGSAADTEGRFSLKLNPGKYQLALSFVGMQNDTIAVEMPSSAYLDLGAIKMRGGSEVIAEVQVMAKAKMMEFEQDKRVFNVGQDLTSVGSNASELLNNLPSVSVGVEGEVSLRGSSNVRILINGKPSGLIGSDPASALRQLQGSSIEKIEVITNPSARYDAEGEAGIINIVLKKQDQKGFNGSFDLSGGYPELFGAGASMNYRRNKLNLFSNISYRQNRSPGGGVSDQKFFLPDTSYSFLRDRNQNRGGQDLNLRFGADYYITESQSITGSFIYSPSRSKNYVDLNFRDLDANGEEVREVNRFDDETEISSEIEADINWQKTFGGNKDHKWTADFRYSLEDENENSQIRQDTSGIPGVFLQEVSNVEYQRRTLFQTDYVHPLGEKRSYEMGARLTLREIENDYKLSDQADDGTFIPDPDFNSRFLFEENVYALYGIYNDAFGSKITYQVGLRAELTDLTTEVGNGDSINPRSYANLFPSAFFTYSFSPLSDLQLSYSRRISRPGFRTLAPFFGFSDNRNFYSGNPNVNPEFTDSYEAGYVRYFEKGSLYSGLYYRHRTGVIERITVVEERDGQEFSRFLPINLAVQDAYGLEFNFQYNVAEWYEINANLNLFYTQTVGSFQGQDFGAENQSSSGRLVNRIKFWKSDLQVSFNMRGASQNAQSRRLGMYTMDLAWSKDFLDGNATVTLSVRDLFNTRVRRYYTNGAIAGGGFFDTYGTFQWRERQITLNLSYRLNQRKSRPSRGGGGDFDGGEF